MRVVEVEVDTARPQTRCLTDHRRRRLHQLLERETLKSPDSVTLRGAKSLPSLMLHHHHHHHQQQQVVATACPSPILTKCTPNLSPLRTQRLRPATRLLTQRTARTPEPRDAFAIDTDAPNDTQRQLERDTSLARQADEYEKRRTRSLAKQVKAAQLDQIQDKQLRRRERTVDAQQVAEQIAWENAQLELVDQSHRLSRHAQLLDLRESQLHSLELERRQAGAAKIARDFFDRLAVLEPSQAMALFTAKQDELVACCLELLHECVERHELDDFKDLLRDTLQKEELLLRHRVRAAQREEDTTAAKKRAVAELKRTQYEEIQRHVAVTREGKAAQSRLRSELDRQHETADVRYRDMQDRKKQRELDTSAKLQEQMRRNRAEHATISLRVDGTASQTMWTPFWSDDSAEARVNTFDRPCQTATSPGRPTIFAKKNCQWYD